MPGEACGTDGTQALAGRAERAVRLDSPGLRRRRSQHRRSVTALAGPPDGRWVLAQYPAISEVSGPAGSVHCWLELGVLALPVLFDVAWQTAATARAPFLLPVSARQRPLVT